MTSEACNGVDDDCDGTIDEGCGSGTCAAPIILDSTPQSYAVTTATGASNATGVCVYNGSNKIFAFTSPITGSVTVRHTWTEGLNVRLGSCTGAQVMNGCAYTYPGSGIRQVTFAATRGQT